MLKLAFVALLDGRKVFISILPVIRVDKADIIFIFAYIYGYFIDFKYRIKAF